MAVLRPTAMTPPTFREAGSSQSVNLRWQSGILFRRFLMFFVAQLRQMVLADISQPPVRHSILVAFALLLCVCEASGQGPETPSKTNSASDSEQSEPGKPLSISELGKVIQKSLVMVRASGRDGREFGHGTGFVISADGLIATARHVIGDGRSIRVELPDGKTVPVTHIHASTESVDSSPDPAA